MNTFMSTTMNYEVARQHRARLETVARHHRLARVLRRDARRRGRDPGRGGTSITELPLGIASPRPVEAVACKVA